MRVIICGAGQVGYNIAAYLAREDNDVTVIDTNPQIISRINEELDVNAIQGHANHPDVLAQAGAQQADLVIAVTNMDEINMVTCQVAHSLFAVPKKIARIREQAYTDPAWSNLFSRAHMPIDVIVSPEVEVAHAIHERLRIPGTTNVISLARERVHLVGVLCKDDCPIVNTQFKQIKTLFPNLPFEIALIMRDNEPVFPHANEQVLIGDEVFFFTDTPHLKRVMAAFGHVEQTARSVTILGGGNVGTFLANLLHEDEQRVNMRIIEFTPERALKLSETIQDAIIIEGSGLDAEILKEANIEQTETFVAVTNDDQTNILSSLLAKQHGCERVITLVNNPSFTPLVNSLGIDTMIAPRYLTVSRIMQHIRRGRIKALFTLRDGIAEVIEAEISSSSSLAGMTIKDLDLPRDVVIGAVVRDDEILMPEPNRKLRQGDHIIILSSAKQIRQIEQMFTVQVDLF